MDESPRKVSAYPPLIALGVAIGEIGVLFGLVPLAVGGVVLFGWCVAGMAREAGFARSAWRSLALVGVAIGLGSLVVWGLRAEAVTVGALATAATTDGIAVRAAVVLGAAAFLVVAGTVGALLETGHSTA